MTSPCHHLDATCFLSWDERPAAGSPSQPACGATEGAVTLTLEGCTCPTCKVKYDAAMAAGSVRLLETLAGHVVTHVSVFFPGETGY